MAFFLEKSVLWGEKKKEKERKKERKQKPSKNNQSFMHSEIDSTRLSETQDLNY